jgi:hypothetical protein
VLEATSVQVDQILSYCRYTLNDNGLVNLAPEIAARHINPYKLSLEAAQAMACPP